MGEWSKYHKTTVHVRLIKLKFSSKIMEIDFNDELAEIVGLSFGDGSLTIRKEYGTLRFQLRGNTTEDRDHYDEYIIPIFNRNVCIPLANKKVPTVESRKTNKSYGIAIQNEKIGEFLNKCGIPIGIKNELRIPEWIKLNDKYLVSFLRGLLDTDGSVFCKRNYSLRIIKMHTQIKIRIATTSKLLATDVKEALDSLGILCFFHSQARTKPCRTAYFVEVSGGINVDKWFEMIGSKNPKHITKYQTWKKFGFCPPFTDLKQRKDILSGRLDPYSLYAGLAEWSKAYD